jgi:cytochrome b561
MKTRNDTALARSYGAVSIILHWLTAFLVIAIFALALAPGLIKGSIALHGTLGVLLLALVPLRAAWRMLEGGAVEHLQEPQALRVLAKTVHGLFYLLLVAVPALGLIYVDAKGIPFTFFGVALPQIAFYSSDFAQAVYGLKAWLAYSMLALIFVHAAAAIAYHQFLRRDRVLRSMLVIDTPAAEEPVSTPALVASTH